MTTTDRTFAHGRISGVGSTCWCVASTFRGFNCAGAPRPRGPRDEDEDEDEVDEEDLVGVECGDGDGSNQKG